MAGDPRKERREEEVAAFIWQRIEHSGRGPRPSLTHDQIARAAIALADADGIEAVSMRRVAAELGAGTMTLYRYVATRDELLDLMIDAIIGDFGSADRLSGDWRRDLAAEAHTNRAMMHAHPWSVALRYARPSFGPNGLANTERVLASVDGVGLDIDGKLDLVSTMSSFVLGFTQAELAEQEARRRTGLSEDQWRASMGPYIEGVLATKRYPFLERVIVDAEDFPDPDAVFERRLDLVLDGLAARVARS